MAHPRQALSSGTVQWQQGHLRAPSPGYSPSWHCHQPHRLQAGGGQQAQAQRPLSWPRGLHLPGPVLKATATGDAVPHPHPPAMLGPIRGQPPPSLSPFPPLPPFQAQGMLILPLGGQPWSLELSPPGLPSPDFQPLSSPRGTSSLPGNKKPRVLTHSRGSSLPHLPQDLVF